MRRAARILFHLAAGVSGVLFLLAVWSWSASYRSGYVVGVTGADFAGWFMVSRGETGVISLTYSEQWQEMTSEAMGWSSEKYPPHDLAGEFIFLFPANSRSVAGFGFHRPTLRGVSGFRLIIPIPFLIAVLAPLPLIDAILIRRRRRQRRRAAAGLCVRCGYDLRASPERCPECGALPVAPPARPAGPDGGDGARVLG